MTTDDGDDRQRRPQAGRAGRRGQAGVLRRHRPALDRRQPGAPALHAAAGARLRVGLHRLEAAAPAAVDRRRRAGRDRRRRRQRARDLRLLAAGGADRRRVPRRRPTRQVRQHQLDRDRRRTPNRAPACPAPAARRDRGVRRRRDGDHASVEASLRRALRLPILDRLRRRSRAIASDWASAVAACDG